MNSLATVAVFRDWTSASFYQSLLEENGLDAFVPDEYVCATRDPGLLVAVGHVRVQVPADQAAEALHILTDLGEEMAALSVTPEQLRQAPVLPPVTQEWKNTWLFYGAVMLSTLAVTWPLFGFASSLGYTFSFPNRHRPPLSESLPFDLLSVFFVIVGCVILYCLLRYLLRPRPNDVLPGPASVTEDDFVPGPEGQPGEQVSFWSERFGAPRFVIRWLLFAFLIALVHHAINLYFAHV